MILSIISTVLLSIFFYVYFSLSFQTIAKATSVEKSWMAWVPILNIYLMCKIAGKPGWWLILFFVPIANIVIPVIVLMEIAKAMNKPAWLGLLFLVPIANIFLPGYLAFEDQRRKTIFVLIVLIPFWLGIMIAFNTHQYLRKNAIKLLAKAKDSGAEDSRLIQDKSKTKTLPPNAQECRFTGISNSASSSWAMIGKKIYRTGDTICRGKITSILENTITLQFDSTQESFKVGSLIIPTISAAKGRILPQVAAKEEAINSFIALHQAVYTNKIRIIKKHLPKNKFNYPYLRGFMESIPKDTKIISAKVNDISVVLHYSSSTKKGEVTMQKDKDGIWKVKGIFCTY